MQDMTEPSGSWRPNSGLPGESMSIRTAVFVLVLAGLGLLLLATMGFRWHVSEPQRFFAYLSMAVLCSLVQVKRSGFGTTFSVSMPFVLISIVQLSLGEAVVVGCCAALVQGVWARAKLVDTILAVGLLATVIATADFVDQSLLPRSLHNPTVRLFVVALALFVANTFPAAIAARLSDQKRLSQRWKESFFWSFPYYVIAAAVAGVLHLASTSASWELELLALPVIYLAYRYYRGQKAQLEEKQKHAGDLAALHLRAIEGLALAVEAKDNLNTRGHLRRVQAYALGIGKAMGLDPTEIQALHAAALLHDIGKLAVPEHILSKPGKLSAEEFAKMKVHPLVGAEIVEQMQFPYPVAPIVRAHHEKWDGSGYPLGLKGEEIPLGARILTTVDCLDALTSDREYRKAAPIDEAMEQISADAGKAFDPRVIEVLQRVYRDLEQEAATQTDRPLLILSRNSIVEKGEAPGAGLSAVSSLAPSGFSRQFLASITAARQEEKMFFEIATGVGNSLDLAETLRRVDETLSKMIPSDAIAVFIRRANLLASEYARGDNKDVLAYLEVPMGQGLAGWVAQNVQPIINANPAVDPGFSCKVERPLHSALALPLEGTQGVLGVIALYRRENDAFTRDELRILTAVTPKIATAVENALKYKEAEVRANIDGLTGLPNAHLMLQSLESELARAHRFKQSLAVVVCQLAGHQQIAEEFGHAAGDLLLRTVAKGLRGAFRDYDHVGRIGEATFALVLPGMKRDGLVSKLVTLDEIAREACERLGRGTAHFMIGEAFYPDDGDGARQLLSLAERRLSIYAQRQTADLAALHTVVEKTPVRESHPVRR
jgi:diguanylate cyclase (GGDEF)-like protein/putative nucleotidyltransferase with HDIG domain